MVVSAIINQGIGLAIDPVLRFLFFILTTAALWQALETNGSSVVRRLLFVFAQPIVFQLASLVLGVAKAGELDGSISYIGGYYHEELFSLILVAAFLTAILATKLDRLVRAGVFVLSLVGIFITDYRTTILAVVPLAMMFILVAVPRLVRQDQRTLVRLVVVVGGSFLIIVGAAATGGRFSDLAAIQGTDLFKPPEAYTYADQRVLSARPYIWSQYIYAYAESPEVQKVVGHGPDSWVGNFPLYAHNTVVSFLYELGVIGVAALLWLWLSMFRLARQTGPFERPLLTAGHVSFFLLNMATMPHWQIEGNIFYGLLCGYTIAKQRLYRRIAVDNES
jgi:O-antigen ligase